MEIMVANNKNHYSSGLPNTRSLHRCAMIIMILIIFTPNTVKHT